MSLTQGSAFRSSKNGGSISSSTKGRDDVRVVCRVRPVTKRDLDYSDRMRTKEGLAECVSLNGSITIDYKDLESQISTLYTFDKVFGADSSQESVFQDTASPLIDDVLRGYNATILAYGQTGTGKTFTMEGDVNDEAMKGVIPRSLQRVFSCIQESQSSSDVVFEVRVSFIEIYMERIKDLLDPSNAQDISIREDKLKGLYVQGVTEKVVSTASEVLKILRFGSNNRATTATLMNEESSRSHSVFTVSITQSSSVSKLLSKLVLVDLAGSEMVKKTNASGQQLEEAKTINKSLSALGLVINALTDSSYTHIPYRDSKLTRILQDSLGGNAKTALIINISPVSFDCTETLSTLRFGSRAKFIQNKAHVNQIRGVEELERLLADANKIITDLQGSQSGLSDDSVAKMKRLQDEVELLAQIIEEKDVEISRLLDRENNRPGTIQQSSSQDSLDDLIVASKATPAASEEAVVFTGGATRTQTAASSPSDEVKEAERHSQQPRAQGGDYAEVSSSMLRASRHKPSKKAQIKSSIDCSTMNKYKTITAPSDSTDDSGAAGAGKGLCLSPLAVPDGDSESGRPSPKAGAASTLPTNRHLQADRSGREEQPLVPRRGGDNSATKMSTSTSMSSTSNRSTAAAATADQRPSPARYDAPPAYAPVYPVLSDYGASAAYGASIGGGSSNKYTSISSNYGSSSLLDSEAICAKHGLDGCILCQMFPNPSSSGGGAGGYSSYTSSYGGYGSSRVAAASLDSSFGSTHSSPSLGTSLDHGAAGLREYVPSSSVSPARGKFSPIAVHSKPSYASSAYSSQQPSSYSTGVCGTHGVTDCLLCSLGGSASSSSSVGIGGYSNYQHAGGHSQFSQFSYRRLPGSFPSITAHGVSGHAHPSMLSASVPSLHAHPADSLAGHGVGSNHRYRSDYDSGYPPSHPRNYSASDYGEDSGVDEPLYSSTHSDLSFQRRTAEDTTATKKKQSVTMAADVGAVGGGSSRATKGALRNQAHSAHGKLQLYSVDGGASSAAALASSATNKYSDDDDDDAQLLEDSGGSEENNVYSNITYDDTYSDGAAYEQGRDAYSGLAKPSDLRDDRGKLPKIKSAHAGDAGKAKKKKSGSGSSAGGKPHPYSAGPTKGKPSPYGAPVKKVNGYMKVNGVGML